MKIAFTSMTSPKEAGGRKFMLRDDGSALNSVTNDCALNTNYEKNFGR